MKTSTVGFPSETEALVSLRNVEGVYGSFLLDAEGKVCGRDLPLLVSDEALRSAGPRIALLWGTLPVEEEPVFLTLEFKSHRLHALNYSGNSLCILTPPRVNLLALKMAAKLVAQQLSRASVSTQAERVEPPADPQRIRVYRGVRYET